MNFVGQALNLSCVALLAISVVIFWRNKQLKREITQLTSDAESLKTHLENTHQTCKDKVVGAFPRIPATHVVTHNDDELQGLNIENNVTFILLHLADNQDSWSCVENQIKSIQDAFPNAHILLADVTTNSAKAKPILGVTSIGVFANQAEALNMAIKRVNSLYFFVLAPGFVIEPKGSDTSIEWLHHALVITPGVDIIGGSVLHSNNELVVPCYSVNLCNWTLVQKYEYKRSFGEIMICNKVSHSFMARKDIVQKINVGLFDENLNTDDYIFIDFFLQAKQHELTIANRPEVLFVQQKSCISPDLSDVKKMENAIPFARKHQVIRFKNPENIIHSICEVSSTKTCTIENMLNTFKFPKWYENGMFAYPFVIEQAISTLEVVSEQLRKADVAFALRGETLFGAVMTKSILPWGVLDSIQLTVFGTINEITKFATTHGYKHNVNANTVTLMVQVANFHAPMKVELGVKSADNNGVNFVSVHVNGKLYPAPLDPIEELKNEYGENYLAGKDSKIGIKFSCKMQNHHACLPAMSSRGGSTYQENYCEI